MRVGRGERHAVGGVPLGRRAGPSHAGHRLTAVRATVEHLFVGLESVSQVQRISLYFNTKADVCAHLQYRVTQVVIHYVPRMLYLEFCARKF